MIDISFFSNAKEALSLHLRCLIVGSFARENICQKQPLLALPDIFARFISVQVHQFDEIKFQGSSLTNVKKTNRKYLNEKIFEGKSFWHFGWPTKLAKIFHWQKCYAMGYKSQVPIVWLSHQKHSTTMYDGNNLCATHWPHRHMPKLVQCKCRKD